KGGGDVVLDNNQCVFVSHVTAVGLKDKVAIRNSDPILHNTHGFLGAPTVFNVALPTKGQMIELTKYPKKAGVVRVLCDAHPHVSARMTVHDSPYFAVTGESGAVRITHVPPGPSAKGYGTASCSSTAAYRWTIRTARTARSSWRSSWAGRAAPGSRACTCTRRGCTTTGSSRWSTRCPRSTRTRTSSSVSGRSTTR